MISNNRVQALKFRTLDEDEQFSSSRQANADKMQNQDRNFIDKTKHSNSNINSQNISLNLAENFNFKFSYPAVSFQNVRFCIDSRRVSTNFIWKIIDILELYRFVPKTVAPEIEILKNINMEVQCGSIFGLLGPSSCGKTTLLRCLVGLLEPKSGTIRLFGHKTFEQLAQEDTKHMTNSENANVEERIRKLSGRYIGYMPQDLGLYPDLTIRQILTMFGRYVKMSGELIHERISFMARFLDLPDVDRTIASLSGGQQRRVSFAIACIHMPPLIILDEPTVGVDPLLRQAIWKYLRQLASEENRTIIITTHYIEEAAQADKVALMRAGQILVQDTPKRIMQMNGCTTLEDAFLRVCNRVTKTADGGFEAVDDKREIELEENERQVDGVVIRDLSASPRDELRRRHPEPPANGRDSHKATLERNGLIPSQSRSKFILDQSNESPGSGRLAKTWRHLKGEWMVFKAVLYKNYRRNINAMPIIAFQFLLPVIQMVSFSLCVGGRPANIGIGLVNNELPMVGASAGAIWRAPANPAYNFSDGHEPLLDGGPYEAENDTNQLLSVKYLSFIDPYIITFHTYSRLEDAVHDVSRTKLWAAMEISANFSSSLVKRFDPDLLYELDHKLIEDSVIKIYPDRSNKVLDLICMRTLVDALTKFMSSEFDQVGTLPIEMGDAVYRIKPNLISDSIEGYTESIAAGLLASLTYMMAAGLTTFIMVVERDGGILERTYSSGINPALYLITHAIFRSFMMMIQIALVLFVTFYVIQQPCEGPIWLTYVMLMMLNITGISFGLATSAVVDDQNGAALTVVSALVLKVTTSGILWPFEAIPYFLRPLCYFLPLTMPIHALKNITLKGATLTDRSVITGFAVSTAWTAFFLIMAARRFKFYKH